MGPVPRQIAGQRGPGKRLVKSPGVHVRGGSLAHAPLGLGATESLGGIR